MTKLDPLGLAVTREEFYAHCGRTEAALAEFTAKLDRVIAAFAEHTAGGAAPKNLPIAHDDEEEGTPWPEGMVRLKDAAFRTGYSQSGIRAMIRREVALGRTSGARVYVKLDTIPRKKCEKV